MPTRSQISEATENTDDHTDLMRALEGNTETVKVLLTCENVYTTGLQPVVFHFLPKQETNGDS